MKGNVLYHPRFRFSGYYPDSPGCHHNRNVFIVDNNHFIKKTWIQFDPNSIFEIKANMLMNEKFKHDIQVKFHRK